MKRGDWVQTSPRINPFYADRTGRVFGVLEDHNYEVLVGFHNGDTAWFRVEELTSAKKKRGSHNIVMPPIKTLRAEHLVPSLA